MKADHGAVAAPGPSFSNLYGISPPAGLRWAGFKLFAL